MRSNGRAFKLTQIFTNKKNSGMLIRVSSVSIRGENSSSGSTPWFQRLRHTLGDARPILPRQIAFPNPHHTPTCLAQGPRHQQIALAIPRQLRRPPLCAILRQRHMLRFLDNCARNSRPQTMRRARAGITSLCFAFAGLSRHWRYLCLVKGRTFVPNAGMRGFVIP